MKPGRDIQWWLYELVERHGGAAGTVHAVSGDALELRASLNIPPGVVELTRSIPIGKGMAGLAWERNEPVSTCNLATDRSGDVREGAREVDAQAAVALPVHDKAGAVRGVVGIAFAGEREMGADELALLSADAERAPF